MKKILIVEDDSALAGGLCRALGEELIGTESCRNICGARQKLMESSYSLMILDVNLPDGNGLDFLKEVKEKYDVPVIILTANDLETDIVVGLETGAEDYITKPFSLAVLRARVKVQLRKQEQKGGNRFIRDEFDFRYDDMEFYVKGNAVELSKTEQKLLRLLTDNEGVTLGRLDLIDRIWTDGAEYVDENALSVTVKRLRDKLSAQDYIKTVYGIGYTWVD